MTTAFPTSLPTSLGKIQMQIMWDRLIAVVEEQAQTLIRTAFSSSTREAGDVSAGVYNLRGEMLAQAVTGTPGHVNAMAESVGHFLLKFPVETMKAGDSFVTNDPWKGTGHLHDFTVVTPVFRDAAPVALFACTTHVVDVGGLGFTADGRQVFEEGIYVPLMKIADAGVMNADLLQMVRANVREPAQVEGDLYSLTACNEDGGRRLIDMMGEYGLETLNELGGHIMDASRSAMRDAVRALPDGVYKNSMRTDGYESPIDIVATMTIKDDQISVDFAGTSGVSSYGINVPLCYTKAYASFGVRVVVGNRVPNNSGSLSAVDVTAPEGTILNAQPPCAVCARHVIGQMLPDAVLGCLHQVNADLAPAEGSSSIWAPVLMGGHGVSAADKRGENFTVTMFNTGGTGARPHLDGLNTTGFPSGIRNVPVEITEAMAPVVIWRKDFRPDSGGAGQYRGGVGQIIEIGHRAEAPFAISAMFDRVDHPARGRSGGQPGKVGIIRATGGAVLKPKGKQTISAGERLVLSTPGGGGFGDPLNRDISAIQDDVRRRIISINEALNAYGVVITSVGDVDELATEKTRANMRSAAGGSGRQ